jgi:hypothetical protein
MPIVYLQVVEARNAWDSALTSFNALLKCTSESHQTKQEIESQLCLYEVNFHAYNKFPALKES